MKVSVMRMALAMTTFGIMVFQSVVLAVDPDEVVEQIKNVTRSRIQIVHRWSLFMCLHLEVYTITGHRRIGATEERRLKAWKMRKMR